MINVVRIMMQLLELDDSIFSPYFRAALLIGSKSQKIADGMRGRLWDQMLLCFLQFLLSFP
jgi:hypothetical protein